MWKIDKKWKRINDENEKIQLMKVFNIKNLKVSFFVYSKLFIISTIY